MKLSEIFKASEEKQPQFENFRRQILPEGMPPLKISELFLERLIREERIKLRTPFNGTHSLVLNYKGKESSICSLDEKNQGETWNITQVQGAKTKKSYRVASCLQWQKLFGDEIMELAQSPDSVVRQIMMPIYFKIKGAIDGESENIALSYNKVINVLNMRYSDELGLFVRDIKR